MAEMNKGEFCDFAFQQYILFYMLKDSLSVTFTVQGMCRSLLHSSNESICLLSSFFKGPTFTTLGNYGNHNSVVYFAFSCQVDVLAYPCLTDSHHCCMTQCDLVLALLTACS